jgi:BlaI family transcriptional regulator, penicillinase repressor
MAKNKHHNLTRRERQIIDVIYRLGSASVAEVLDNIADPPSYSAVRALMRLMEEKGYIKHRKQGAKFIYSPTQSRYNACRSALKHLVHTFFNNSAENAVVALLDSSELGLSEKEMDRISKIIDKARKNEK